MTYSFAYPCAYYTTFDTMMSAFSMRYCPKAIPHNSVARCAVPFPPSPSCKNLDLRPVNLRFLQVNRAKNSLAHRSPHLCGITLMFPLYFSLFLSRSCRICSLRSQISTLPLTGQTLVQQKCNLCLTRLQHIMIARRNWAALWNCCAAFAEGSDGA